MCFTVLDTPSRSDVSLATSCHTGMWNKELQQKLE